MTTEAAFARQSRPRASLAVDRILCDGYGLCAELLPELIDLDDWGYPILKPGGVPPELEPLARRAIDVCPVLALRLVPPPRATMAPATAGVRRGSRPGG